MSNSSVLIPAPRHVPDHILEQIASYSAEPAIWKMMAASKALREAGERELKRYLRKQKVASYVERPQVVREDGRRTDDLIATIERFSRHLAAYPPARTQLRHLVIELREDTPKVGWELLGQLGGQLEVMELHIISESGEKEGVREAIDAHLKGVSRAGVDELWRSITHDWTDVWSALTHLSLQIHTGLIEQLHCVARLAPNMVRLSLSSHLATSDYGEYYFGTFNIAPVFNRLIRLDISGTLENILYALHATQARRYPTLHGLTLHVLGRSHLEYLPFMLIEMKKVKQISGLALYGELVPTIMYEWAVRARGIDLYGPYDLANLKSLAIEEDTTTYEEKTRLGIRPQEDMVKSLSHLPALLPALSHIIWVSRRPCNSRDAPTFLSRCTKAKLLHLLELYPKLDSIEIAPGYPLDPSLRAQADCKPISEIEE